MKTAVSVSLGSSKRNKHVEVELLGETISIERRGTDGDVERATALFNELDGEVDALGVGGIDLWIEMAGRKYPIHAANKMVAGVTKTPVVDGSGLKNTLEADVARVIAEELGDEFIGKKVMLTAGVDRFGMTRAFYENNYDVVCADLMFALGIPIAIHKLNSLLLMGRLLLPIVGRLPISMLYPTGEKQEQIEPKFTKWYDWADIIGGDCLYIKQHMPDNLAGKLIVTNTTTPEDMQLFRDRGVRYVLTTTPQLEGRSFGTNMMEAALTAIAGKGRPLTGEELGKMIAELDMKPSLHDLSQ